MSHRLDRSGTPRKPKMNKHPASRRRVCPACGKRFATRPAFREHIEVERDRLYPEESDAG